MKDKIIVSDYFHEEEARRNLSDFEQTSNAASPNQTNLGGSRVDSSGGTGEGFSTSQRLSHSLRDSNNCLGLGYMPLNSTSDVGFNQYPLYSNNLLFNLDSFTSEDPLLFNSQQLINFEENDKDSATGSQTKLPNLERLESCVSEISTSSSECTQELERSPSFGEQVQKQSLFDLSYSTFSSDSESSPLTERSAPRSSRGLSMMKNDVRVSPLPSLETLRKQVNCELNIHHRRMDQQLNIPERSLNVIMTGCSSSGKSHLKSLLSSVMEFESERILPSSESYPKLVFRPVYRNLDHGTKTYQVNQDESQISFYKWDENFSRCSVMFQPIDSDTSDEVVSQRVIFTDMPGIQSEHQCANYCKLLSQLYVGMFVNEMDDQMVEYGFENIKAGAKIQQVMCHDIVLLTIPIEFTENELKITRIIQQYLDLKGIPYLVVATKTDLVGNERKIAEKKKELARFLNMRSFDILQIGMSGKTKEGIEDFELIRNELHKECMLILRQLLLQFNKKRNLIDRFKMDHAGLSPIEHFIKTMTMSVFHYWLILHKVIHWIVIGPQTNVEESREEEEEDMPELEENKPLNKVSENQPISDNNNEKQQVICKQVFIPPLPLIPPKPTNEIHPTLFKQGPSQTSAKPQQQIVEPMKEIKSITVEESDSSESDEDILCEEQCIYYTKPKDKKEKSHPIPLIMNENDDAANYCSNHEQVTEEDEECSAESSSYYLCSMRIFQCIVVSLLFVLVFQSFALFAFQHLSYI